MTSFTVNGESKALVLEWIIWLQTQDGKSPATAKRYADDLVGRPTRRLLNPAKPLLEFWAALKGPEVPIWTIIQAEIREWYIQPVRARGGHTKPPSGSVQNTRQVAAKLFFKWLRDNGKPIDPDLLTFKSPYWDKRKKGRGEVTKPNPMPEGVFRGLWHNRATTDADKVWIGQGAFVTQRVGEMANMLPSDWDLEARTATFVRKGGEYATVRYGELIDETWWRLAHLDEEYKEWEKLMTAAVEARLRDVAADPNDRYFSTETTDEEVEHPISGEVIHQAASKSTGFYNRRLRQLLIAAGFDPELHWPHQLRAFAGTNMYRAGVSRERIMEEMNHGSFETTKGYIGLKPEYDKERRENQHQTLREELGDD